MATFSCFCTFAPEIPVAAWEQEISLHMSSFHLQQWHFAQGHFSLSLFTLPLWESGAVELAHKEAGRLGRTEGEKRKGQREYCE